jgi:hypothetical protein
VNIPTKLLAARDVVTSKAGLKVLAASQHAPTIMFGAGVVGVVTTVVLASKATLHLDDILDARDNKLELAEEVHATDETYTEVKYKSDVTKINILTGLEIAKLYAPAFTVGVLSLASLTGAHYTLNRRNTGLLAAYATLDQGFKKYRERVTEELGEDKEREFYHGTQEVEILSEKKNGEPVVNRELRAAGYSPYARIFGPSNPNFEQDPTHNIFFLRAAQSSLQTQLQTKGWVTLNDAFDQLGMDRTEAGMVVGWRKNHGDNTVDFGIWDDERMEDFHNFMVGREREIVLDFNVDGAIYGKINKR